MCDLMETLEGGGRARRRVAMGGTASMVDGVAVHYRELGSGTPVLLMHGAGVDHREMAAALEPLFSQRPGYRRIYMDLPGMGRTPADTVNSNDDVLDLLIGFAGNVIGDDEFLVVGHSYGGYLCQALAHRCTQVAGLALICPVGGERGEVPEHVVLHASGELECRVPPADEAEFRGYFVVQNAEMLQRFEEAVVPAMPLADESALARIFEHWRLTNTPADKRPFTKPVLILAGRQDSSVGYANAWNLVEHYPRATFAVIDRAGHALPHEQEKLVIALMAEWLDRVQEHRRSS
jgi:pimeloyl-ACP methyl ester carboxylesterase